MDTLSNTAIEPVLIKSESAEELQAEQQATNMPANMANQQELEDNQIGDKPKLNLVYSNRDRLVANLTQLSAILQCNQSFSADEKQQTHQKFKESILLLMDLSSEVTPSADDSNWLDQLTYELPRAERSRISIHLIEINAALSDRLITDETKRSLVNENKRIIVQMLDLPCKVQGDMIGGAGSAEEENKNIGEPLSKKQKGR